MPKGANIDLGLTGYDELFMDDATIVVSRLEAIIWNMIPDTRGRAGLRLTTTRMAPTAQAIAMIAVGTTIFSAFADSERSERRLLWSLKPARFYRKPKSAWKC